MQPRLSRLFLLLSTITLLVCAQQQVTLQSTNPDIVYSPPLCNPSAIDTGCVSSWQTDIFLGVDTPVVAATGPIPQTGNIIPQMFLSFRASTLYLRTSPLSNATVNFSLTAVPTGVTITRQVNTSVNLIIAVNLPETQTTILGITLLQGPSPTRFDIESIMLTVANGSATSSYLPSLSLPASSRPPTVYPSSSSAATSYDTSQRIGTIVGAALGGGIGILVMLSAGIFLYRKWHRPRIWWSETDVKTQEKARTR